MNLNWQNWSDFFAMGGYGLYVWGSFGVTAAVILGELLALRAGQRALVRDGQSDAGLEGSSHET